MQFYKRVPIIAATVLALINPLQSIAAGPPPPSGGPPEPVLAKIELDGPVLVDENTSASYICTATYSDGVEAPVTPEWSTDSAFAVINASGELTAGNVTSDEVITISAHFGEKTATFVTTIKYAAPVISSLVISGPAAINEGASGNYTCVAMYSDGSALSVVPAWNTSLPAAAIDSAGILIAGSVDSDQLIDVIAGLDGVTGRYAVTIRDVPVTLEGITIQGAVAMDENAAVQLNCIASYSDGSQPLINPVWSVNSAYAQISQNGLLTSGDVPSDQGVVVSAGFDGFSASHSVVIRYTAPVLERIEISGAASVDEGSSAVYTCAAYYDDGTSKAVHPSWSENSSYASVDANGLLVASDVQSDQTLTLTASYEGKSASKQVAITYDAPTVVSLSVVGATIVEELNETGYACAAVYSDGTSKDVTPVWSVSPELAQIGVDGRLLTGEVNRDESVTVTALYGGSVGTLEIVIKDVPPPVVLDRLSISGLTEVMERESIALVCKAYYSDGTSQTVTPVWSDDSGAASISASGEFSAGNFESAAVVEVTAAFGGLAATHQVSVGIVGTEIIYPLNGFDGRVVAAELYDNETGEWRDFGPFSSPEALVLDEMTTNQWYWVSVLESNTTSNVWVEVQGNWLNL